MDLGAGDESAERPVVVVGGKYMLKRRIGSGSFAVVWRARHLQSGAEVAVKEIDTKRLYLAHKKLGDNLLKEISILTNIRHPNIIRLFDVIRTEDTIYLVLEYCNGGDLAAYIHRRGKVSEALARHFMNQLAAGLQVLNENHVIHRDLKPQNLLLSKSNNEEVPQLKIGDFGFARYLEPQGLADTLCGSPLYMAPEIIQNKKYDSKTDLWSVGAILFQLVTGKPPFDGDSQPQLFENILRGSELQFPEGTLGELTPECVALCKSLLCHNPDERLPFEEFFNHTFLREPRLKMEVEKHSVPQIRSLVEQSECLLDKTPSVESFKMPLLHLQHFSSLFQTTSAVPFSLVHNDKKKISCREDHGSASSSKGSQGFMSNILCGELKMPFDGDVNVSSRPTAADSMELIEKDYVFVNVHFTSTESLSCPVGISLVNNSCGVLSYPAKKRSNEDVAVELPVKETTARSLSGPKSLEGSVSASSASATLRQVQEVSILHPSTRLKSLHQYICILSELAQARSDAGLFLESFSVQLVVLAIWKEALKVCSRWLGSSTEGDLRPSAKESGPALISVSLSPSSVETVDFSTPQAASIWVEQGFLVAFDVIDKLSNQILDKGTTQMPDAMEIIFQTALEVGKVGGVDELMGNMDSASELYSKAILMLSFIVGEATILPLNPTFSLTLADRERILGYIVNLKSHLSHFKLSTITS
ncbi:serine/threonine-protein kinase ATG1a isoform X2 [Diospyros lotus]|uniref:serine/threonine-protein kinase ATG1a isoform X2 n=1 Tax=Diospyros lotus TaxID=55363 RepID=UPI0022581FA7|nr:serine/threonine-protein kinase ATG1a isoform X2 [Diospyros lotus]